MAYGSGMLVNRAEILYAISFYPGGTSMFLTLSTKSPLFWMWRSDLPTREPKIFANTLDAFNVRLPRLATIVHRGTFAMWILGRPYILGISPGIDKIFESSRDWVLPLPSLNHFGHLS